jgi:hypothetical protein
MKEQVQAKGPLWAMHPRLMLIEGWYLFIGGLLFIGLIIAVIAFCFVSLFNGDIKSVLSLINSTWLHIILITIFALFCLVRGGRMLLQYRPTKQAELIGTVSLWGTILTWKNYYRDYEFNTCVLFLLQIDEQTTKLFLNTAHRYSEIIRHEGQQVEVEYYPTTERIVAIRKL